MFPCDAARVLCEPVGPKNLSADWPDESPARAIRAPEKLEEFLRDATGRGYSCHGLFKVLETCRRR